MTQTLSSKGERHHAFIRHRRMFTETEVELINQLRLLWEQHVAWTRMTIISIVENLADVDLVIQRLLRNPTDFQLVLIPFYGPTIASEFAQLLTSHLTIAAELVKAAKAGDTEAATNAENRWYVNATEIAIFLGKINPFWSEELWRMMLFEHLALTKDEAVAILTANYERGIAVYDEIEHQALTMADVMAAGIIDQFPELFKV